MIGQKILLIDNNADFLRLAGLVFREAGAQIITASDGMEGIGKALTYQPNLIILGTMTPEKEGLQVYKKIRQFSNTPLIMLSSLDRDQLVLQGWEAGVDDFLTKPISPETLLLRAKTVIRRNEKSAALRSTINYDDGHLKIDVLKHRVLIKNKRVKLTPVEFRLLVYLVSNADQVLSFDEILANVWGSEQDGNNSYVHVYISHLRSKIEEYPKEPRYIRSIHGVGYIFEKQDRQFSYEKSFGKLITGNENA